MLSVNMSGLGRLFVGAALAFGISGAAVAEQCPKGPNTYTQHDVYIRLERAPGDDDFQWRRKIGEINAWWSGVSESGRLYFPGFLNCAYRLSSDSRADETAGVYSPNRVHEVWLQCRDASRQPVQRAGSWPREARACTSASASTPTPPRPRPTPAPSTSSTPTTRPAAPPVAEPAQPAMSAAEEAAQRAATDRLNAETAQRDAATVARNEAAQRDFARRQAEHRRQLAAVEAEAARSRREAAAREQTYAEQRRNWEAQVAACNRGDRAACAGQTPAAPAQGASQTASKPPAVGPRQVYYFIYAVNGEHVGYVAPKAMTASELKAEEALVARLAVERYGSGVRVLTLPVSRDAACSQLYLGSPNDKTYNLKTGSRESVEKGVADQIRLFSGRAVSSIFCGG